MAIFLPSHFLIIFYGCLLNQIIHIISKSHHRNEKIFLFQVLSISRDVNSKIDRVYLVNVHFCKIAFCEPKFILCYTQTPSHCIECLLLVQVYKKVSITCLAKDENPISLPLKKVMQFFVCIDVTTQNVSDTPLSSYSHNHYGRNLQILSKK